MGSSQDKSKEKGHVIPTFGRKCCVHKDGSVWLTSRQESLSPYLLPMSYVSSEIDLKFVLLPQGKHFV